MITLRDINVSFGANSLLKNIDLIINKGEKVALAGKNGAGKSTLLQIIAGKQSPSSGSVSIKKDISVQYLPQQMKVADTTTLLEETKSTFSSESTHIEDLGSINAQVEKMLLGLGFMTADFNRPTAEFSGGWRMRIELAKILLKNPDVLLLDEPTNHLDIESIRWLENFLKGKNRTLILVSHDKAFLDNVTERTVEINCGHIYDYKVNYSRFISLHRDRLEQQRRAYENQQKEIAEIKNFIERFRYKATKAVQVQSRIKQLEKIVPIEIDEVDNSRVSFRFPPALRSGDYPVIIENLRKAYGQHLVIDNVQLTIKRGEKVAFVGKNGEGKSTLVKCITGEIPYTGKLTIGHNVTIGYFSQNEAQLLDTSATVFDTVDRVATGDIRTRLKDLLGAFRFSGEDIDKKVSVLSGGEKTRLAMLKLLLQPGNLLIMDEPTNHLDIATKEILKEALKQFDGTLIIVSHDRDFLNGLVDKVYEFGGQKVREHLGGIEDFLYAKGFQDIRDIELTKPDKLNNTEVTPPVISEAKANYLQQKETEKTRKRLEKAVDLAMTDIERLETEIKNLENRMSEGETSEDIINSYSALRSKLQDAMEKWEKALEELENYQQ